jgi:hypothetical protein
MQKRSNAFTQNLFEEYALKSNTLDREKEEWLKWAKEKSDRYDLFLEKEVKLLKELNRETLKPIRKNYW